MEVMEDGNLMDKVHILIQRDLEYYKEKQTTLQEIICPGVVGGKLDFPRSASFAATKLVLWWEEEYVAAYRKNSGFLGKNQHVENADCPGMVKASDPSKFVALISKSAEKLLEHLHVLTQEALDHADLAVLTGTIGASALLKNCLKFYMQTPDIKLNQVESLQETHRKYQEMGEALAERLLDLHLRLLSLYILQEAESSDWENEKCFCECERGSYVIQMWWLYMQGTKDDLWSSVPPKMAQRVFAGMLNESLTILTVRYTQISPSQARSQLHLVDISNLLLCVAQLLPHICDGAEELIGLNLHAKSKIIRDVHAKCQELLCCFILRGASLDDLHKVFRKGIDSVNLFKAKNAGPAPWIIFALPNVFKEAPKPELDDNVWISLELMVLLAQPQPNWTLLVKVLGMKKCKILRLILELALANFTEELQKETVTVENCNCFLCPGDGTCKQIDTSTVFLTQRHYYDLIMSSTAVSLQMLNPSEYYDIFLSAICKYENWSKCLDRRYVWNQIRPPWYEVLLLHMQPLLPTITETVISAVKTRASTYQAMLIILASFSQMLDFVNIALANMAKALQELLPADVTPLHHSAFLQMFISAQYTDLLEYSQTRNQKIVKKVQFEGETSQCQDSEEHELALAIAESLCSIDEDNKHTDQIEEFLQQVQDDTELFEECTSKGSSRVEGSLQVAEDITSDLLMTALGKKSLKCLHQFIQSNHEWFMQQLGVSGTSEVTVTNNRTVAKRTTLLSTMFHIGYRTFDQLLTGTWKPNWVDLLQTPMGLSADREWSQISQRWEFRTADLSQRDSHIVASLASILKQT